MRTRRGVHGGRKQRDLALMLALLAGVLMGLVASLIGVLINDFVVGTVVTLIPSAVLVTIWWRRYLD